MQGRVPLRCSTTFFFVVLLSSLSVQLLPVLAEEPIAAPESKERASKSTSERASLRKERELKHGGESEGDGKSEHGEEHEAEGKSEHGEEHKGEGEHEHGEHDEGKSSGVLEKLDKDILETKLTLSGLQQYYVKLTEEEKLKQLLALLDSLSFDQVVIFVKKGGQRALKLDFLLDGNKIPSIAIHSGLRQEKRNAHFEQFNEGKTRIMVTTDRFRHRIDTKHVNIVVNYDMPDTCDSYLHRVGLAGRFGTNGLALTFVTNEDEKVLKNVQARFEVSQIDKSSYL